MRFTMSARSKWVQTIVLCTLTLVSWWAIQGPAAGAPATGPATLSLPSVTIAPDTEVVLDLTLTHNPGDLQGIDLTITFDPAVVAFQSVSKETLVSGWSLQHQAFASGRLVIGLAGAPIGGDGVVLRVSFQAVGDKGDSSALAFTVAELNEGAIISQTAAGQIAIDTPPVIDLTGDVRDAGLELSWTHAGNDAHHYELWKAENAPYFLPTGEGVALDSYIYPWEVLEFTDSGNCIGSVAIHCSYVVRTIDANGRPSPPSNRVMEFEFGLAAGSSQ